MWQFSLQDRAEKVKELVKNTLETTLETVLKELTDAQATDLSSHTHQVAPEYDVSFYFNYSLTQVIMHSGTSIFFYFDHSHYGPQFSAEFRAEPRNLPFSVEFWYCRGISWNFGEVKKWPIISTIVGFKLTTLCPKKLPHFVIFHMFTKY